MAPGDRPPNAPAPAALAAAALLPQVARALRTRTDARLAPLGVTSQQAALLVSAARDTTSPSSLMEHLGTDTAGMTRLLDHLERKGLARRTPHPKDRRAVVIEVTDAGRALAPRLAVAFGRTAAELLAGFSAEEATVLGRLLERMADNLDRPSSKASSTA